MEDYEWYMDERGHEACAQMLARKGGNMGTKKTKLELEVTFGEMASYCAELTVQDAIGVGCINGVYQGLKLAHWMLMGNYDDSRFSGEDAQRQLVDGLIREAYRDSVMWDALEGVE